MPKISQQNNTLPAIASDNGGPKGAKLEVFSAGRLNPGAGLRTAATHQGEYCGVAWARIYAHEMEESKMFPGASNVVFAGQFNWIGSNGVRGRAIRGYLPGRLRWAVTAPLDKGAPFVDTAFEIWTEHDPSSMNAQHFRYVVYDRCEQSAEIDAIAIAAGIIQAPPVTRVLVSGPSEEKFDPETGEIRDLEDALNSLVKGGPAREAAAAGK
jgi:hypothetical protein